MEYLNINEIYHGRSENLLDQIQPESIALSFWSPPYYVGKEYEKGETYETWQRLLKDVIEKHFRCLKPGGFLIINIADILCFKDENMPKIQAQNIGTNRCGITREMVLEAKKRYPSYNKHKLAEVLGCSEQTVDRRLNGNNIRGGKYGTQTRVKLVGGELEKYSQEAGFYLYDRKIWMKDPAWANSRWTTNTYRGVDEFEHLYIYWKPGEYTIERNKLTKREWIEWGSRAIWKINSVARNDDHEAKFPLELAVKVIRLYTDENDIVIDPFIGSGTTAVAARKLGRRYIGIDKEEKYVQLAKTNVGVTGAQSFLKKIKH